LHFFQSDPSRTQVSLNILTPHGDNVRQEIGAAFEYWYQGHYGVAPRLNWIDEGGTSEDLRYVEGRFAKTPSSIGIDLFFGGGVPPFKTLAKRGWLQAKVLSPALLSEVPETVESVPLFSSEEGWYGVALSSFGILFNRLLLKDNGLPEPKTWADLAHPRAQGWVACIDPRGSGSAHVIYEIILQKYGFNKGWEILTRLAANSNHFTKGASAVLPLVSSGEAAYSLAIDQYAWSLVEKFGNHRIGFVLPSGATVVTPDPVGLLKGAPHPVEATRFMEFLLSDMGQLLISVQAGFPSGPRHLSINRMSVLPRIFAKLDSKNSFVRGNPFKTTGQSGWVYSDSLTESRWSFLNDALGLWMVDYHTASLKTWMKLRDVYPKDESDPVALSNWENQVRASAFFKAPMSEAEVQSLSARWHEESFRNTTMAKWARELND
jgi:ABC-type Fe3+ transport system substrate-binding protein